jgi:hypothetical protein
MSLRRLMAFAVAATVLVVSGCGGSAGSSKRLTRSELIARGNTICRRLNTKLAATTIRSARDYVPLAAYEHAAVMEMRKLTPPASMTSGWGQMVAGTQMLADATAKLGTYPQAGGFVATTPAVRTAFTAAVEGTKRMTAAAGREGFKDCARTP